MKQFRCSIAGGLLFDDKTPLSKGGEGDGGAAGQVGDQHLPAGVLDRGGEEPRVEVVMGVPVAGNVTLCRAPRHSTPRLRLHHPIAANQLHMTQLLKLTLCTPKMCSNILFYDFSKSSFPPSISEAANQLNATKTEFCRSFETNSDTNLTTFQLICPISHLPSMLCKGTKDVDNAQAHICFAFSDADANE